MDYDPEAMTISCTFENELDISPKLCSVKYGTCDEEMYFAQGNTTDRPIILELNPNAVDPMNCYIVTANNDTLTAMIMGKFGTPSNSDILSTSTIVTVIVALVVVGLAVAAISIIVTTVFVLRYMKMRQSGK